ncbi:GNAT family N-acetyltransferase [Planococcus lenghuensis]|uniref:GNAT family N-acetyltransferase n=1 Tax=Planococcus lenghuensis TaxID=2213202 RepID=A0A1Q2KYN1_9BACL|nr:GNAT family protein [Planococcus lenghuensis]AQQ53311.1 GNAT family N-acetyltransferase [Planococcus lenghuensis]
MQYQEHELSIRPVQEEDLHRLWELIYGEDPPHWKKWDAPYYEFKHVPYAEYISNKESIINNRKQWLITVQDEPIGTVSYYWEHEPSNWLEAGIVIYRPEWWSGGYGTRTFRLWIHHLFETLPLVRVGYSTWSGNERMIHAGEKLGMQMEARIRKARYYNGTYYDSIKMGILREEWEALHEPDNS